MLRNLFLILITITAIATGCKTGNKPEKPTPFLKPEKLATVLTDMYLSDGLLNIPKVREDFFMKDTISAYLDVLGGYGLTRDQFEANLDYYFVKEPKKFQSVYDRVLANLSNMQAENSAKRTEIPDTKRNLWNGKLAYRLPDDAITDPIEFSIETSGTGIYTVRARVTVFEDDQSENLTAYVYFWYDDGTEDGYVEEWDMFVYEKSGRSQNISLKRQLSNPKVTHIRGRLLDHSVKTGHWEMHSSVSGINVSYEHVKNDEWETDALE